MIGVDCILSVIKRQLFVGVSHQFVKKGFPLQFHNSLWSEGFIAAVSHQFVKVKGLSLQFHTSLWSGRIYRKHFFPRCCNGFGFFSREKRLVTSAAVNWSSSQLLLLEHHRNHNTQYLYRRLKTMFLVVYIYTLDKSNSTKLTKLRRRNDAVFLKYRYCKGSLHVWIPICLSKKLPNCC